MIESIIHQSNALLRPPERALSIQVSHIPIPQRRKERIKSINEKRFGIKPEFFISEQTADETTLQKLQTDMELLADTICTTQISQLTQQTREVRDQLSEDFTPDQLENIFIQERSTGNNHILNLATYHPSQENSTQSAPTLQVFCGIEHLHLEFQYWKTGKDRWFNLLVIKVNKNNDAIGKLYGSEIKRSLETMSEAEVKLINTILTEIPQWPLHSA